MNKKEKQEMLSILQRVKAEYKYSECYGMCNAAGSCLSENNFIRFKKYLIENTPGKTLYCPITGSVDLGENDSISKYELNNYFLFETPDDRNKAMEFRFEWLNKHIKLLSNELE